jgi:hypothetical protein
MKKHLALIAFIIYTISIILCLYWYDWRLLIIIFLFTMANNIERHYTNLP